MPFQRRPFVRFLLSLQVVPVHLLCGVLVLCLGADVLAGRGQPDYKWGLLFTIVAYPMIIGLMWWQQKLDRDAEVDHVVRSIVEPDEYRVKRERYRRISLFVVGAIAAWLTFEGQRGLDIGGVPAQYAGYGLFAFAMLGFAGVNVWRGGPLDPRNDPPHE